MTPKEKADELIDKMLGYGDEYHHCTQYVAKQCALIAVEEILNYLPKVTPQYLSEVIYYWQQVKTEIENL